ncbi:hypothetical protein B0T11DRAFT_317151 [Plectosphaerella cucumerina]|uniref:Uncharacterized protein n=1 Tax=Plectosphaerella cucumerina TaxID=40658 RepID=A0A8K0X6R9_9PEZI|nr:hypothetical protein B0T11DRAFT_317151 [Plectosphaerella cucumerina]
MRLAEVRNGGAWLVSVAAAAIAAGLRGPGGGSHVKICAQYQGAAEMNNKANPTKPRKGVTGFDRAQTLHWMGGTSAVPLEVPPLGWSPTFRAPYDSDCCKGDERWQPRQEVEKGERRRPQPKQPPKPRKPPPEVESGRHSLDFARVLAGDTRFDVAPCPPSVKNMVNRRVRHRLSAAKVHSGSAHQRTRQ